MRHVAGKKQKTHADRRTHRSRVSVWSPSAPVAVRLILVHDCFLHAFNLINSVARFNLYYYQHRLRAIPPHYYPFPHYPSIRHLLSNPLPHAHPHKCAVRSDHCPEALTPILRKPLHALLSSPFPPSITYHILKPTYIPHITPKTTHLSPSQESELSFLFFHDYLLSQPS